MSRHRLFLDSPAQVGKNRITLPKALADYYGNTATAYVNGRQVLSKTELDGTDYKTTFVTPTPVREIEIGRGNLELTDTTNDRKSVDFTGSNYISSVPAVSFGTTFTIETWVKFDSIGTDMKILNKDYRISISKGSTNKIFFLTGNGSSWNAVNSSNSSVTSDVWYHLAWVVNGSTGTLYINGILDKTGTHGSSVNTTYDIGRREVGDQDKLDGSLSEMRIWNSERTQQQIKDNMYKQLKGTETGLLALYPFVSNTADATGNGHTGTENGTFTYSDNDLPLPTQEVLHWTPSSESGYYWVLTEDESGNTVYVKVAGTWVEGQLFIKVDGSWKQASNVNIKTSGEWR